MTAAWAAAALLDALRAEVAGVLDDEHASRQHALEQAAGEAGHGRRRVPRRRRRAGRRRGHRAVLRHLRSLDRHLPRPGGVAALPRRPGPRRAARAVRGGPSGRPGVLHPARPGAVPAQARTAGQALADAITYRLERAGGGCADCADVWPAACPDHVGDTGRALAYRQLAATLARALPEMAGEER